MYPQVDFFGSTASLHHIGLAVSHIERSQIEDIETFIDPTQRVKVGFINVGNSCIELVEPLGDDSPVSAGLKRGQKLLHLCFEVDDLLDGMRFAEKNGFKVIQTPTPAVAFSNRKIAWVYHTFWGLYELLERNPSHEDHSL